MYDWSCAETIYFLYFVQFVLMEFQRFCFHRSSCHSLNTSSFWCEYRIKHCIEFITGQKFLVFIFAWGFIHRWYQNNVWSLVISDYFYKTTNQLRIENSQMTGLKDSKSCQENVSLSLAKRKVAEKNEWKFSNQSGGVIYASIYLTNHRKSLFFRLAYLEYNFIIANLVRLNVDVLKIFEASQ